MKIGKYTTIEKIYSSKHTIVYRGEDLETKQKVVIKCLASDFPTQYEIDRLHHQIDIVRDVTAKGIIKPDRLIKEHRIYALVMEDIGARSLRQAITTDDGVNIILPVKVFLEVAVCLAHIIGDLHDNNIIHKDIKPDNILVTDEYHDIKIIDFSISTRLSRELDGLRHDRFQGTLAYISPEQSGKMNRGIDYRTDFYSLGITFYELLTGRLPFKGTDALETVYFHIAKTAVSPHDIDNTIPKVLSDIIMKLLEKKAEDRYQSAHGLCVDLEECYRHYTQTGDIPDFELGHYDISNKFKIPEKLYGRDKEIYKILSTFRRVCEKGTGELLQVAGYPGIGKTACINEVQKLVVEHKGYFIKGKYDQFSKNVPYSALLDAFQSLIHQILHESDERIAWWKSLILETLGDNTQVIINVIPDLEIITGKQPDLPELGPQETKNRFELAFRDFVRIFATSDHPVSIFIDDMQWIDLASTSLFSNLLINSDLRHLFIIGSYRDNEISEGHPITLALQELQKHDVCIDLLTLSPLTNDDVTQMLRDTLLRDEKDVRSLADTIHTKTGGNPFFIKELLKTLYDRGVFSFQRGRGWYWNDATIKEIEITENVVDLLTDKLKTLDNKALEIIKLASCIGNKFDMTMLAKVSEINREDVRTIILILQELGVIYSKNDMYYFIHDRIQEAAYLLIDDEVKKKIHYRIGNHLLKGITKGELRRSLFYIVNQFNSARELFTDDKEKLRLAKLNCHAGITAKKSTAYEQSASYFAIGIAMLDTHSWVKYYGLSVSLYTHYAEALYLTGDYEGMELNARIVLEHAKNIVEIITIYEIQLHAKIAQGLTVESVEEGVRILRKLGIRLPFKPKKRDIIFEVIKTKRMLRRMTLDDIKNLPPMSDPEKKALIKLMAILPSPTYLVSPLLFSIVLLKTVQVSLRYGNCPATYVSYANYSIILCSALGEIEKGYNFGKFALDQICTYPTNEGTSIVYFIFNTLIKHWKDHLSSTIEPLMEGYHKGLEAGNLEFACQNLAMHCVYTFYSGKNLQILQELILRCEKIVKTYKQERVLISFLFLKANTSYYIDGEIQSPREDMEYVAKFSASDDSNKKGVCYLQISVLYYMFNNNAASLENFKILELYKDALQGLYLIAVYHFYYALALLKEARSTKKRIPGLLRKVAAHQKKIKMWAAHAPMNYQHKYDLIEAERLRMLGKNEAAALYYEKAVKGAREYDYIQEEGLAHECAGTFYQERGLFDIAHMHITKALNCFRMWNASAKVAQMEERHFAILNYEAGLENVGDEKTNGHTSGSGTADTTTGNFDIDTIIKSSQTLSGEIHLDLLLKKMMKVVMENGSAHNAVFILNSNEHYTIEAHGELDKDVVVLQSAPIEDCTYICRELVQYCTRAKKSIVLNDAMHDEQYKRNLYIRDNKIQSVLCLAIIHQKQLKGLLYLENRLTNNAFNESKLKLLEYLSSQLAISLENALLYSEIKEKERLKRELEIAERIQTAIIPNVPEHPELDISAVMKPTDEVGGDYYDIVRDINGVTWFAVGDVSGHGVTPGLVMMMAQSSFSSVINEHDVTPREAMTSVNALLYHNIQKRLKAELYMTMMFFKYIGDGKFLATGAGHTEVIIYRKASGRCEKTHLGGLFLGLIPDAAELLAEVEFQLEDGDILFLYTDGIIESQKPGAALRMFETDGVTQVLEAHAHKSLDEIRDIMLQEALDWCDHAMMDDMTMMLIRRR